MKLSSSYIFKGSSSVKMRVERDGLKVLKMPYSRVLLNSLVAFKYYFSSLLHGLQWFSSGLKEGKYNVL